MSTPQTHTPIKYWWGKCPLPFFLTLKINFMTLSEFKSSLGIKDLNFYKSKSSGRFVAGLPTGGTLNTTEDFDAKKPVFVYDNPKGNEGVDFIASNKEPRAADFVL